jgi:hypothetical protein
MIDPLLHHCERHYADADVLTHAMAVLLYRARHVLDDALAMESASSLPAELPAAAGELEFTLSTALMIAAHARTLHSRIGARMSAIRGGPRAAREPVPTDPRLSAAVATIDRMIALAAGMVGEIETATRYHTIARERTDLPGLLERLSTF